MTEARNTQIIKDAYAAFMRGDVKTLLGLVADDAEWHGVIGAEGVLPQAGLRRGKEEVAAFFAQVAQTYAFEQFEPREFVAQGDAVVALGHYRAKTSTSGRMVDADWVMVFNLRDGKIVRFREFTDSAQLVNAY